MTFTKEINSGLKTAILMNNKTMNSKEINSGLNNNKPCLYSAYHIQREVSMRFKNEKYRGK